MVHGAGKPETAEPAGPTPRFPGMVDKPVQVTVVEPRTAKLAAEPIDGAVVQPVLRRTSPRKEVRRSQGRNTATGTSDDNSWSALHLSIQDFRFSFLATIRL